MRFLMVTHGSEGDYFPFTLLGRQLQQQGHEVILLGQEDAERLATKHGLGFHSICPIAHAMAVHKRLPELMGGTSRNQLTLLWDIMWEDVTRRVDEKIEELLIPGETVVFSLSRLIGARIARDRLKFPLITVNLTPICFDNFMDCDEQETEEVIGGHVNRLRAQRGLPPLQETVIRWSYSPDLVVGFFPEWFAPRKAHWPQNTQHTPFPLPPVSDQELDPQLTACCQAAVKPLVIIAGTFNLDPEGFLRTMYELCERLQRPGILLGWRGPAPQDPPENFHIRSFVPLSALLPHADLFIHHAGVGTLAEGIRAGIPQIALPHIVQQKGLGKCIETLGLGYSLETKTLTADQLQPLAIQALDSAAMRATCSSFARHFQDASPLAITTRIMALVEALDTT